MIIGSKCTVEVLCVLGDLCCMFFMHVCACEREYIVCSCVRACVLHACVRACVHTCVHTYMCVLCKWCVCIMCLG